MKARGLRELDDLDLVFKALAHTQRRRILQVLDARGGSMSSGQIADRFSCTWPTTTRHLRTLEDAGLVTLERQGREWNYTLNRERLARVAMRWLSGLTNRKE